MEILYVKALHIIFVVTWFAGLFYSVRLFIYYTEAHQKEEPAKTILKNQYRLMSKRLWYGITWPSAILTAIFASWLLSSHLSYYLSQPWMHIKLTFVLALYVYHYLCHRMYIQLQNDQLTTSSFKLRLWNEVATVFLFAIVFLVVLKSAINWVWGMAGLVVFTILLLIAIKAYKKMREKGSKKNTQG